MSGRNVLVIGGSAGLGKEMSKVLASQGANVTIVSRKQTLLDEAKEEILRSRKSEAQTVTAVAADMSDVLTVGTACHLSTHTYLLQAQRVISSQPSLPDVLYCVAGGTAHELGFLVDLQPEQFVTCMNNNFYSSLYPSQALLNAWVEDDRSSGQSPPKPKLRKIIYVNSSASLAPSPGYLAYNGKSSTYKLEGFIWLL